MLRRGWLIGVAFGLAAFASAACSREPDAKDALSAVDVITGWLDKGIVDGQNKLVPTISLKVKNGADQPLSYLQLNAVFRIVDDTEELGSKVVWATEGSSLEPGKTLGPFNLSSDLGYSSSAPRVQMLQHSQFKDAKVEVFVKHGSRPWVRLGDFRIDRQLLAR